MASNATNRRDQLRRQQEAAARQSRTTRIIGVAAGVLALVLIGVLVYAFVSQQPKGGETGGPGTTPLAAQIVPPNANADKDGLIVAQGAAGTPTVTMYLDYQCPNCRTFELGYGQMLDDEAKAGTWTLENKTMVFMDNNLQNTASTRAALAASCAATVDHYKEYSLEVYNNQALQEVRGSDGYSDQLLRETIPAKVGIAGDQLSTFQACYDGRATQDFVAAVDKAAYADGVTGTPSMAVNGKLLNLSLLKDTSPAGLKAFILANTGA
ncbi:thioredoxin domain-containing protein [Propioniciclava coleopterorum]|uniref:Thioredoxin domain-containing protein n=1 Tax=Propioniciclava coleopterorum TaxID=2714937 RepID=A0A6G7Y3F9_9ACTN|nr:thioredoxin domain-containing protein [Propioniciclava coleopterorum]QIK71147.1 thioredoxin domain-containing protein [Propioniciclava coleopterorum]